MSTYIGIGLPLYWYRQGIKVKTNFWQSMTTPQKCGQLVLRGNLTAYMALAEPHRSASCILLSILSELTSALAAHTVSERAGPRPPFQKKAQDASMRFLMVALGSVCVCLRSKLPKGYVHRSESKVQRIMPNFKDISRLPRTEVPTAPAGNITCQLLPDAGVVTRDRRPQ